MHDVDFDFDGLSFGLMEYLGEAGKQRVLYNTNSPAGWKERYLDEPDFEIDPRTALQGTSGVRRSLPCAILVRCTMRKRPV